MVDIAPALRARIQSMYGQFGQGKEMGASAPDARHPHFFLHRTFWGEQDLLIILNTKRCRYQCYFCQLPSKSSKVLIPAEDILAQFEYVLTELKHSLSVLDRITLSNEGSVLDVATFPLEALIAIAGCIGELRRVRTVVLETRLEFVKPSVLRQIGAQAPKVKLNILTGFETVNPTIRDTVLGKKESLAVFENGLDRVAESAADLTAYVLYKPSPLMSDSEAAIEAEASIDYLRRECTSRGISFSIRLNPMYAAHGSRWEARALRTPDYRPPRLTDVMRLAEKKSREGIKVYIGLSTEGLSNAETTYKSREDYSSSLIRPIKLFNDGKARTF